MAYPHPDNITYEFAISRGLPGHTVTTINGVCDTMSGTSKILGPVNNFGFTIGAHTTGADYVVVCSSDAVDATAGTGAREVVVSGVLDGGTSSSESIYLEGNTEKTTTAQYKMINRMYVNSTGSGGVNAGNIFACADSPASTIAAGVPTSTSQTHNMIGIGHNASHFLKYSVPVSYTAHLTNFNIGSAAVTVVPVSFDIWERKNGQVKQLAYRSRAELGSRQTVVNVPFKFEALTDIWIEADNGGASATSADCTMQLVLIAE